MELSIQKGKKLLHVDICKWSSRSIEFRHSTIKTFKSINNSYISCDSYNDLDEALDNF